MAALPVLLAAFAAHASVDVQASSALRVSDHPGDLGVCPTSDHVFVTPKKQNKNLDACSLDDDCHYERRCAYDDKCNDDCDGYVKDHVTCMCLHKTLLPDVSARDIGAMVCVLFGCMLAASAGIGGGGLFVPIYMLINGFIIEEAIPLSHATVMGNSVAQLLVNLPLRHDHRFVTTDRRKPMIDYSVPLLLLPGQLGGNNLGVLFFPIFPPDLLIIISEMLLAFATIRVFEKGWKMFQAERLVREEIALIGGEDGDDDDVAGKKAPSSAGSRLSRATTMSVGAAYIGLPKDSQVLQEEQDLQGEVRRSAEDYYASLRPGEDDELMEAFREIEAKETSIPVQYIALMGAFWCVFAAAYVGMKEFGTCSAGYFGILIGLYPILLAVTFIGSRLVTKYNKRRDENHVQGPPGEVVWTNTKLVVGPLAAVGVGFIAGLLGLGGGELMAPLLLELGLLPKAASATSAYMIIWTTSSNMVHYAVGGDLATGYAICFCLLGFVGGGVGRFIAMKYTSKGRQSPIAFALGSVLALSMILLAYRVGTSHPKDPWWPFKSMC
eukprot:TRINITY_DN3506_c0_g1_i1.p1 TRINITY_DN3506_c0_g1~~TRINITY_DN3506_c0_g1_i1.p1  ORF type:complete len:573 (+),score=167.66 TRINITY_DN3506_c0_g1_i1:66-1721(+)